MTRSRDERGVEVRPVDRSDDHRTGEVKVTGAVDLGPQPAEQQRADEETDDTIEGERRPLMAHPHRPFEAARLRLGHQWRKWRSPVNTIATPRASAAAIVLSSFTDPPGCTMIAAPASAAASMPSGKG